MTQKKILIIAGSNGAGKTTFANVMLAKEPRALQFINADHIASRLSPHAPQMAAVAAGKRMIREMDSCVERGESFSFETTLSGLVYRRKISRWRELGYRVKLWFLVLPNEEAAVARVAERVRQGGHDIPENVIRRRYNAGFANFADIYMHIVDSWVLFDSGENPPRIMDWSMQ